MYYRPPIYNIILSYLSILAIVLVMTLMGEEGNAFAHDLAKTYAKEESRQDILSSDSIVDSDAILPEYIVQEKHNNDNSIETESADENKSIKTNNVSELRASTLEPSQEKIVVKHTNNSIAEARPVRSAINEYWNINIASLTDENKANELVHNAKTKGVDTIKKHITVNGKNYWRVSVKGLPTQDKAKSYALLVKSRLGLQNVWISKESDQF